ncbi:hypothetical protein F5Y11DRAFT_344401 [Daldinia sp. FL1419]|nr:hypothetical protein F5Y11DRAFT_344401 [Daldinia sp. FL1419]
MGGMERSSGRKRSINNRCAEDLEKPKELQLPSALGYVRDPDSSQLGLVFELLGPLSIAGPPSLYIQFNSTLKPSLNVRLKMAQELATSLEHLHASRWLHKGLRSDNILFLPSYDSDWTSFCLSGFDYSRPVGRGEMSDIPSTHETHDLYRHPNVQFDVPRESKYGFKEEHDIYSLGVVLMEIGSWQSIQQFLGFDPKGHISLRERRMSRATVLEAESQNALRSEIGERFSEAVELCLLRGPKSVIGEDYFLTSNSMDSLQRPQEILRSISL